jgi:thiol-disulfide isomerase/thioredoxin
MSVFNQFSFVLLAGGLLLLAGLLLWRLQRVPAFVRMVGWLVLLIAVFGVWLALRPTATPQISGLADVEAQLGNGTPVVIELYSEYCLGCMAQAADVLALEQALGAQAAVLRLSIHTEVGQALWERYNGESTPTFIILDGEGREVARTNSVPSTAQVLGQTP